MCHQTEQNWCDFRMQASCGSFQPTPTSPVLLPALVPPDFTKQSLVCTLLLHRSNVGGNESAGMQREATDACEMARTSVLGPNSHGLSARRCSPGTNLALVSWSWVVMNHKRVYSQENARMHFSRPESCIWRCRKHYSAVLSAGSLACHQGKHG